MSWQAADGNGSAGDRVSYGQTAEVPGDIGATAKQLRLGQRVQALVHGAAHWTGTVETVAVELGVVWIREDGLGERKLLDLREYQIHPRDPTEG